MSSKMDQKEKNLKNDAVPKPQPQNNNKLSTSPKTLLKQIAKVNETLPLSQPYDSPTVHLVPLQTMDQKEKNPNNDVVPKPQPQNNNKLSTSPKTLLKQIAEVNETLPPSQPDDSPTVHLVPLQTSERGYFRRSSGILATVKTPKTLIKQFLTEAPTETPILLSNMTGNNSSSLEKSSVLLPAKVMDSSQNYRDLSVTASDLEEEPVLGRESITSEEMATKSKDNHVGFQKNSSKGLKRPRRQITAKDIADGVKQSQDAEEDDDISLHKPQKATKIRKKITADDIAMGIKQSQEGAEGKPTDIAEMSSNSSLGFLTENSEDTENFLDSSNVTVEDSSDESDAVQTEENPSNSNKTDMKEEQKLKFVDFNKLCLEESLKVLRDASKKPMLKANLEDKPEKSNNSMISQPRKSASMTEIIPSFQLSPHTTKDSTNLSSSKDSVKHTSHANVTNSSCSTSFLKKLTVSLTDISCSGNQKFMTASTKNLLNSTKITKSKDDAAVSENKGKEKGRYFMKENNETLDLPSSSDSELKASRNIADKKDIESKQDTAIISSDRDSDRENVTEEKPYDLKEVLKSKEKSTNCEETKTRQNKVETDKDIFIENLVGIPMETTDVKYTSEFIQSFSLGSLNEAVSSNESQNETDGKIEGDGKNEMEACTQERQNVADHSESKNNFDKILEEQMELSKEPVKNFVSAPDNNNVVLEIQHEEMVVMENDVIEDENEVIEVQYEPIVEILDEEYISLHKEELVDINQDEAFVYHIEDKDTKNLQKKDQMTLNEGIGRKDSHRTEEITVDVQDDSMKCERETKKENELSNNEAEVVVTYISQKRKCNSVVNVIKSTDEIREESGMGENNKNVLQDKIDVTKNEEAFSVTTQSKEEVNESQDEEDIPLFEVESLSEDETSEIPDEVEKSTKGENMSVTQDEGDTSMAHGEEDIPLFEVEGSLSQVEISEISDEADKNTKGENVSVPQGEVSARITYVQNKTGLTLDKSKTDTFQNKDVIGEIQDESKDNMAQNEAEIDMTHESKADGIQGNKIGTLQEQNKTGVTQEESETYLIQNERKAGMTPIESKASVIQDESKGGVTRDENEASVMLDETEAWVTQEESEASVAQDGSEASESQDESVDGGFQTEGEDYASEVEKKDCASKGESEVAVIQQKHNLSEIQEFESSAIQDDGKISVTQDRSKSSMIQHEDDVSAKHDQNEDSIVQEKTEFIMPQDECESCMTQEENESDVIQEESKAGEIREEREAGGTQGESETGETQGESETGETQGESETGETQEESETGETQEESEAGETQGESKAGETQEESEAGETQEESEAGETQEESEAGKTQEESEAGKTQEESEAGETQEESEAGKTQEESEAGETQEESEVGETQEESEVGETQEESEAGETQGESEAGEMQEESEAGETKEGSKAGETREENKSGTKQDKSEFSVSPDESEEGTTPNKGKIMTAQKKNLTLTRDGKRIEDQDPANVIQGKDMPATTNDYDCHEVRNDDKEEQEFDIKVKSVSKNKSISSQRELAENEIQQVDDDIFPPRNEHSKRDYLKSFLQLSSSTAISSAAPKPSTSQNISLKRKGTKRKFAGNHTAEVAQLSAHSVSEKLRRQSRETTLNKTRSYRIVDSLSGNGDSMTINNQTTSQFPLDTGIVPNENQQLLQKTDQLISAESSKISESTRPKKRLTEHKKVTRSVQEEYVVAPRVTASLLSHYSKLLFPTSCTDVLGLISNDYFDNLFATLFSYAHKQRRLTICQSDVELYFKNVGFINENTSLNSLIREHLSLVDQQRLIPVARAVIPLSSTNKKSKRSSKTKESDNMSASK